jgi:hypothetical protein
MIRDILYQRLVQHSSHTRPDQESKSSYVKNHAITQHTLAIIHQTSYGIEPRIFDVVTVILSLLPSYGTIIPYIKSNLLGPNDV